MYLVNVKSAMEVHYVKLVFNIIIHIIRKKEINIAMFVITYLLNYFH